MQEYVVDVAGFILVDDELSSLRYISCSEHIVTIDILSIKPRSGD